MIFDIEGDGLTPTKIHVLAYWKNGKVHHTHDYDEMREYFLNEKILIGHNIILFDIPVVERILKIKVKAQLIDTLGLAWYLDFKNKAPGLDGYGESFGIPKPKIDDWENLSMEEYAHRCREDVKITKMLWDKFRSKLLKLYGSKPEADRFLRYLEFKLKCVAEQEKEGWLMDRPRVEAMFQRFTEEQETKTQELMAVMPKVPVYQKKSRPAKPFKKDGTLSVTGAKWFKLLRDQNLPEDFDGEVEVLVTHKEPNPNSVPQVKDWLFSLGWEPAEFEYKPNDDGSERMVPQLRVEGKEGKELCPSVLLVAEKYPEVRVLEGLSIIQHRLAIFKGFLENAVGDTLTASIGGLTNTLRFRHKVLVNLPGVGKPYGEDIRGSLIAREGKKLCGSDMSSLNSGPICCEAYRKDIELLGT